MSGRREVIVSTAGGFAYLFSYGVVWLTVGLLSFAVSLPVAALLVTGQPLAGVAGTWCLARIMGLPRMAHGNEARLLLLAVYAMPLLVTPGLLALWQPAPEMVPMVAATLFGAHLVPLGWLQRSRAHLVAALVTALGAPLLALALGRGAFHAIGTATGVVLIVAAYFAYQSQRDFAMRASD